MATLTSSWAKETDFVSVDQYNKLLTDAVNAASSRGITSKSTSGKTKTAGDIITVADMTTLRDFVAGVVGYANGTDYPFVASTSTPIAKIYNEVRQVVVDMNNNAGCIMCSSSCKQGCSTNCKNKCYTASC